jgi:DNA-binding MarR family transcriptional regulator
MSKKTVTKSRTPLVAEATDLKEIPVGRMIKMAYSAVHKEHELFVRKAGITVPQWQALMALSRRPGITSSDLALQLGVEAPSVTSLINGMERKGWVTRRKSAEDARVRKLALTPSGTHLINGMHEATVSIDNRISTVLGEGERATLKRLLQAVVEVMR